MESNRILIGIRYELRDRDNNRCRYLFDVSVPRDISFRQLREGLQYGLEKQKRKITDSEEEKLLDSCIEQTKRPVNDNGLFEYIKLNQYQPHLANRYRHRDSYGARRVILSEKELDEKLCDLGFITSTEVIFIDSGIMRDIQNYPGPRADGYDTSKIIEPFSPSKGNRIKYPEYNISTRELYQFNTKPVQLIAPTNPPQKPKSRLMTSVLPSALMMMAMMMLRSSGDNLLGTMATGGMMAAMPLVSGVLMENNQKKEYEESLRNWKNDYQRYINDTLAAIKKRQTNDINKLKENYLDAGMLVLDGEQGVYSYNDRIFSRSRNDEDFLTFRLGNSDKVNSLFEIESGEKNTAISPVSFNMSHDSVEICLKEDRRKDNDYSFNKLPEPIREKYNLNRLPETIREKYRYLHDAPLLYSLKKSNILGVVDANLHCEGRRNTYAGANYLIERMIFDLCFHHSPEDLQFVIFFERSLDSKNGDHQINTRGGQVIHVSDAEDSTYNYRYLPHFHGLFNDRSQFVSDPESAGSMLSQLLTIMNERSSKSSSAEEQDKRADSFPHIVLIVFDEYNLKEHAFARFLPKAPPAEKQQENHLGLSFVFATEYKEYLPEYCSDVIRISDDGLTLTPRNNYSKIKDFYCCASSDGSVAEYRSGTVKSEYRAKYRKAYEFFSGIYYSQIAQNARVPSNVDMYELLGLSSNQLEAYIQKKWGTSESDSKEKSNVTKSLKVPIGRTENGIAYLDIHEKEDGPHMLVAGTTGSGKSETVISWLLALCMNFSPETLNLLLVDMKGGGFTKRLGMLPHVVGSVTDVDGDENGTGAEYMLRRFLGAITAEVKRRKILLNKMHVDNIDDYIKASNEIETHIKSKNIPEKSDDAKEMRRIAADEKLSHLILVIDEFTELKRFSSENSDIDFIGQITTIARVGRSLGYHICLISQNIQGAITEDISVNSKSRLCLKVATRQASKEMIGNDLAAAPSMPGCGRAYLLVGTGSKFEYFQSAYSGAKVLPGIRNSAKYEMIRVERSGPYTQFYNSDEDNIRQKKEEAALREQGKMKTQLEEIVEAIEKVEKDLRKIGKLKAPHQVFQKPLPERIALNDQGERVSLDKDFRATKIK